MLQAIRVQGQGQPQGTALAGATLDAEFTLHQADQLTGNHQPQVAAQVVGREEMLAVQFGLHQRVALFGVHRFARCPARRCAGVDWLLRSSRATTIRISPSSVFFSGVFQQAQQCLAQARRVTADDAWHLRLDEADQFDVLLFGLGAEDAQAVFDQCVEVELHIVQFDLPGFEFGDVEESR